MKVILFNSTELKIGSIQTAPRSFYTIRDKVKILNRFRSYVDYFYEANLDTFENFRKIQDQLGGTTLLKIYVDSPMSYTVLKKAFK